MKKLILTIGFLCTMSAYGQTQPKSLAEFTGELEMRFQNMKSKVDIRYIGILEIREVTTQKFSVSASSLKALITPDMDCASSALDLLDLFEKRGEALQIGRMRVGETTLINMGYTDQAGQTIPGLSVSPEGKILKVVRGYDNHMNCGKIR